MRRAMLTFIALALCASAALYIVETGQPTGSRDDLAPRLQAIVSGVIAKDGTVRNCVLAVAKGDGSFHWSGAAGVAQQNGGKPMTADTPIYIASVTKLFTATVVMRLYEQQALKLDDPMARYLPASLIHGINTYGGGDYSSAITIGDLLAHRSGIADYYDEKGRDGRSVADSLRTDPRAIWSVDQEIARARDELRPQSAPGTATYYSDTNYQLLGKIIEAVTGQHLGAVYENLLFHPLGLRHTRLIGYGPSPAASTLPAEVFHAAQNITDARSSTAYWADGGIVSTVGDMVAFLQALNQGRIIHPDTLELMHHWHKLWLPIQYGYGTMYIRTPGFIVRDLLGFAPMWGHSGSTGSFLYYVSEFDLYMAGTIDQTESNVEPFILMWRVMHAFGSSIPTPAHGLSALAIGTDRAILD